MQVQHKKGQNPYFKLKDIAKKYGVACAYQDLSLCTNLSVYENFALLNVSHKIVDKPGWRTQAKKNAK